MNPMLTSALTTILIVVFTNICSVMAARGYLATANVEAVASAAAIIVLCAVSTLLGWLKIQIVSPDGLVAALHRTNPSEVIRAVYRANPKIVIAAVNSPDNGVKVVSASSPEPEVHEPLK